MSTGENNNKWLDEALAESIGREKSVPDFERFKRSHAEAIEQLKARAKAADVGSHLWRITMKSPTVKIAVAAVLVMAVIGGIYLMTGKTPAVTCCAWAQIADRVGSITTCSYRAHGVISNMAQGPGTQEIELQMYLSSEYGYRVDNYIGTDEYPETSMYMIPEEGVMVSLMPAQKKYMRMVMNDDQLQQWRQQNQDPRQMVQGFVTDEYTELGTEFINGVETRGIEVMNPPQFSNIYGDFTARMWVDVYTELPVRMEMEIDISGGEQMMHMSMVMEDFDWYADLGPEFFTPEVPDDYELMADMKMPGQDEGSAVEGLRVFSELSGGKYPSEINMMTIMQETMKLLAETMVIDANTEPGQEQMQEVAGKMMVVQGTMMFYQKLVQYNMEPAYYGEKVTAETPDSVLMRWKVSENEYRVIFGDLTAENVSSDELVELEQEFTE